MNPRAGAALRCRPLRPNSSSVIQPDGFGARQDLGHLLGLNSFSIERSLEMDPSLMEFAEDEESDAGYLAAGSSSRGR